jgi:hypothetical protein
VLLDRERDRRSSPVLKPDPTRADEHVVVCAACGHHVTDLDERHAVNGAHEHTFVNPAGFAFVIGCWRAAPGCVAISPPDATFSWFPGWSWQVVVCASCRVHLGWRYGNASDEFHGLIVGAVRVA